MSTEVITAVFFIPLEAKPPTGDELFDLLGYDRIHNTFGPLDVDAHNIDVLSDHVCAQIYFLHSPWISRLADKPANGDLPLDRDPALPLAIAFRDAAVRSRAEVAILVTNPNEAPLDKILEHYWMVLVGDEAALAGEHFGLLYLDDKLAQRWDAPPGAQDRDRLLGGPGLTLFSQRGWARWF